MGKLTLSALAVLIKKSVIGVIKYIDLKINANSVHIFEKASANNGYLKTYVVTTAASLAAVTALNTIGEIDIPKDFLLKDSVQLTVVEGTGDNEGKFMVTEEDNVAVETPYEANAQVNAAGSWLDLIVNTQAGDETAVHQLINLSKFIDVYSNGLGLNLSGKTFSIKLNATASGLYVDVDGLKILVDPNNANGKMEMVGSAREPYIYAWTGEFIAGKEFKIGLGTDYSGLFFFAPEANLDPLTDHRLAEPRLQDQGGDMKWVPSVSGKYTLKLYLLRSDLHTSFEPAE